MTRLKTKQIERHQIERFISSKKHKEIVVSLEDSETPDFILKTLTKNISIEHTRFINGQNKMVEQFRKEVIDASQKKFEEEVGVDLECYFHYSDKLMGKEHPKSYYVDMLFNLVNDIYRVNKERTFRVSTKKLKRENLYIDKVTVTNDATWSMWQSTGAFLVKPVDYKAVQKIIKHKASLIKDYVQDFDEKWLVIVAGLGHRSSGYRFDLLDNKLNACGFDKVFFFDNRTEEVIRLSS